MKTRKQQVGGMYGLLFNLLVLAGVVMLALTVLPIYMDEGKAAKIVSQVAVSSQNSLISPHDLQQRLQRRWDVDDVKNLKVKDVKLQKTKTGKVLTYDYEVRSNLFANWDLVISFNKTFPMAGSAASGG